MLETVILINYTSPQLSPTIHAVQNDTGRVLVCKVADFNIPEGAVARFRARKPDGKSVFNSATIEEKKVKVELTSQLLSTPGTVQCNVEVVHNEKKVHSFYFLIEVERLVISDNEIESTNEFSYLDETVDNAKKALEKASNMISSAETAATNANKKAEYAKGQGDYAKVQGDYAKEQGDFAKLHGETAQTATSEAKKVTEQANTATHNATEQANYAKEQGDFAKLHGGTAQTATQTANAAAENANEKAEYAKEQGNYAMVQGDFAKEQGEGAAAAKVQAEAATQSANNAAQSADQATTRANSAAAACEGIVAGHGNKAELIIFDDNETAMNANNVQVAIEKIVGRILNNENSENIKFDIGRINKHVTNPYLYEHIENAKNIQLLSEALIDFLSSFVYQFKYFYEDTAKVVRELIEKRITDSEGAFGLRYYENQLQVKENDEWKNVYNNGIPVGDASHFRIYPSDNGLTLSWGDPAGIEINGVWLSEWSGTKVVMNEEHYPENEKDGQLLLDNKVKNKYSKNGFYVPSLIANKIYYFRLFPYSKSGVVSSTDSFNNKRKGEPKEGRLITTRVEWDNHECIYTHDTIAGFDYSASNLDDFFGYYPCLMKNGVEVGRLNKNDFSKFEDGRSADITSGNAGDVMICFPKRYIKVIDISDGDKKIMEISIADKKLDSEFSDKAFCLAGKSYEKIYIGAYLTSGVSSNNCKSVKDNMPANNITLSTFKESANSKKYCVMGVNQYGYLQALYISRYKSLFCQSDFGYGFANSSSLARTGNTYNKGMNFKGSDSVKNIKLFGLEDLWGNAWEFIDGIKYRGEPKECIFLENENTFAEISFKENKRKGFSWQYDFCEAFIPSDMLGNTVSNNVGFNEFEKDNRFKTGRLGGCYNSADKAGLFSYNFIFDYNSKDALTSARLLYFSN